MTNYTTTRGEEKNTIMGITTKNAMQPHQKGHRPNGQGEVRMTTIAHASKLKGCTHTNEDEEDSNGKLQKVQSRNPSLN
jgi:hypothetical protein